MSVISKKNQNKTATKNYFFQDLYSGYDEMLKCLKELQEELQMLKRKYMPPEVDTWPNFALESQGETSNHH